MQGVLGALPAPLRGVQDLLDLQNEKDSPCGHAGSKPDVAR
ncbi:hypothetical protein WME77_36640 [Sorangium sp. So ce764]